MQKSREASWSLTFAMAATLWGCASPPVQDNSRWPQSGSQAQQPRSLPPDKTPVVNLRIPEQPRAAQPASHDSNVVQASASQTPLAAVPPVPYTATTDRLLQIAREAAESYSHIDSYIARLRRREQINGRDKPEEVMLIKFRKQPWSVYFKWLGTEGAGREVVYVKGRYDDKIVTLLAAGDMPLMPAGRRVALAPDSLLVRASSRHAIYESGIGSLVNHFGELVEANSRGGLHGSKMNYLGTVRRPEFDHPCEAAEQTIPPGVEPLLPRGGRRLWVYDPTLKLIALTTAQDATGHDVEYYCYDRLQFPVRLDDDDFNPDKLWPAKR
jgi:Protein of unknown function (DUF1571)